MKYEKTTNNIMNENLFFAYLQDPQCFFTDKKNSGSTSLHAVKMMAWEFADDGWERVGGTRRQAKGEVGGAKGSRGRGSE